MKNRITDADAEHLLAGRIPEGRPGLAELAAALTEFRSATIDTTPRPSAELAARLAAKQDVDVAPTIAQAGGRMSRFGLAARVAVGVIALVLGVTIAGAAGALPGGAQNAFDDLVSTLIPTSDDDEPAILDEEPVGEDEDTGEDVPPEEDSAPGDGDGDEAESPSDDDAGPGDGGEPDGDPESDEPDEDPGDEEPESESDSDSSDSDDD